MNEIKNLLRQMNQSLDDLRNSVNEYISTKEIKKSQKRKKNIYIDMDELALIFDKEKISLTLNDCIILRELLKTEGSVCTYQTICKALYGYETDEYAIKSIIVAVTRLKRKVRHVLKIRNIRTKGFIALEVQKDEGTN